MVDTPRKRLKLGEPPITAELHDTAPVAYSKTEKHEREWPELQPHVRIITKASNRER